MISFDVPTKSIEYQTIPRMHKPIPRLDPDQALVPMIGLAAEYEELSSKRHSHQRGQLYYCIAGTIKVNVESGVWLVAPQRAVWIPGNHVHQSNSPQAVSLRMLYIDSEAYSGLPEQVTLIQVSSFLRELIEAAIDQGENWSNNSPQSRLSSVVVDRIIASPHEPLHLPLPRDLRALAVCNYFQQNPSLHVEVEWVCHKFGMSQRTLLRVLQQEIMMNLQQWRQQLLLLTSIEMMANGLSVSAIAMDLGYSTPSAFSYMFRQALGISPSEYYDKG